MELGAIVKEYEYEEAFKYAKENGYSIKEVEATDLEVMETETYFEDEEIEEIIQEKQDAEYDEDGNIVVEASEEIRGKRIEVVEKTREVPKIITVRQFKIIESFEPELSYAEKRANEYPRVEEQLDMIYWDNINGTNNWKECIWAIKNKYPKEVDN